MARGVPKIEWPEGARIAVVLQVPFEAFDKVAHHVKDLVSVPTLPEDRVRAGERDLLLRSWEAYGEVGMWRITELLDRHGVTATGVFSAAAVERYPEVARAFCTGPIPREVCAHSYGQDVSTYSLSSEAMRANVRRCKEIITKTIGTVPVGWVSPGGQFKEDTPQILAEEGFIYHGDYAHSDIPFKVEVPGGRKLVGMSVPWDTNDVLHNRHGASLSHYVEMFCRSFDVLYEEGGQSLGVVNHAATYGRPFGVWAYDQCIRYIKSHPKVWIATRKEIAEWFMKKYM